MNTQHSLEEKKPERNNNKQYPKDHYDIDSLSKSQFYFINKKTESN